MRRLKEVQQANADLASEPLPSHPTAHPSLAATGCRSLSQWGLKPLQLRLTLRCPNLATPFWFALIALIIFPLSARESSPQIVPLTDNIQQSQSSPNAALRWNAISRALVKKNLVDPLWAARTYAVVSVTQHNAVKAVQKLEVSAIKKEILIKAAVASSSATALSHLFPHEVPRISEDLGSHLRELQNHDSKAGLASAAEIGRTVALSLIRRREIDGSIRVETIVPPSTPGIWHSSEQWAPLRPFWGDVQPFIIKKVEDYEPPPPPAADSAAFLQSLAAVRESRKAASAYNEDIARKWADGPGTATPAGRWNDIAAELISRYRVGEQETAMLFAYLNMALMDTSILCWRAKFKYWLPRPPQVDAGIVPSFPLPNFPSYPSGHAAFSGAAATFLSYRFPDEKAELIRLSEEAAQSRVVSGIHYPFDSEVGLSQGRKIANLAISLYEDEIRLAGVEPNSKTEEKPK